VKALTWHGRRDEVPRGSEVFQHKADGAIKFVLRP